MKKLGVDAVALDKNVRTIISIIRWVLGREFSSTGRLLAPIGWSLGPPSTTREIPTKPRLQAGSKSSSLEVR
jgi:hypothetical protein